MPCLLHCPKTHSSSIRWHSFCPISSFLTIHLLCPSHKVSNFEPSVYICNHISWYVASPMSLQSFHCFSGLSHYRVRKISGLYLLKMCQLVQALGASDALYSLSTQQTTSSVLAISLSPHHSDHQVPFLPAAGSDSQFLYKRSNL